MVPFFSNRGLDSTKSTNFAYQRFNFNIVDTLKVPDKPGDYVLSFRWDCEQVSRLPPRHRWIELYRTFSELSPSVCAVPTQPPDPPNLGRVQ